MGKLEDLERRISLLERKSSDLRQTFWSATENGSKTWVRAETTRDQLHTGTLNIEIGNQVYVNLIQLSFYQARAMRAFLNGTDLED